MRPQLFVVNSVIPKAFRIPDATAQAIRETCIHANLPLLEAPQNPSAFLYGVETGDDFVLYLGNPEAEPERPTWRKYLWGQGVDADSTCAVEKWFRESEGRKKGAIPKIDPEEPIGDKLYERWLEWDYALHESPQARAYRYLENLDLWDGTPVAGGDILGRLIFVEGAAPGSNDTFVRTTGLAGLACLQHRLNALNEAVEIKVICD